MVLGGEENIVDPALDAFTIRRHLFQEAASSFSRLA